MIRQKELHKKYKDSLEKKVNLGKRPENLKAPLDSFLYVLYDNSERVSELQNITNLSTDEITKIQDELSPLESAVDMLASSSFKHSPYLHLGAKVTDAGDKLDSEVTTAIRKIGNEFNEKYHPIESWKPSYGLENLSDVREELDSLLDNFKKIYEVFTRRRLPLGLVIKTKDVFDSYQDKRDEISKIDNELEKLEQRYLSIDSYDHMDDFYHELRKLTRDGILKGDLIVRCKRADYHEGKLKINDFLGEVEYVAMNYSSVLDDMDEMSSELVVGNDLTQLLAISQIDEGRFDDHPAQRYLNEEIMSYKRMVSQAKSKAQEKISEIKAKTKREIEDYKNRIETLPNLSGISEYLSDVSEISFEEVRIVEEFFGEDTASSLVKKRDEYVSDLKDLQKKNKALLGKRELVQGLKKDLSQAVSESRLDRLCFVYNYKTFSYTGILSDDYKSESDALSREVDELINRSLSQIEDIPSPKYRLELLKKISGITDVSDRIETAKYEIEQAGKENVIENLNNKISEMQKEFESYRIDLSRENEIAAREFQARLDETSSAYEKKTEELERQLRNKEKELKDYLDKFSARDDYSELVEKIKEEIGGQDVSAYQTEIDRLKQQLVEVTKEHYNEVSGLNDKIEELKSEPESNNPFTAHESSKYHLLNEVVDGEIVPGGWNERLDYIQRFISDNVENNIYLDSPKDLETVQYVHRRLDLYSKNKQFGKPERLSLRNRLTISKTLSALHNYIEESKAVFGPELATQNI